MSSLLLTLQKILGGALNVNDATSAPARYFQGVPLEADGDLAVDTISAITNYSQGLPITAVGRIATGNPSAGRAVIPGVPFVPPPPSPPVTVEVGDLRYSLVELDLPWLLVGETYLESAYPDLATLFTVTSGEFDVPDLVVPGYFVYIYSGVE